MGMDTIEMVMELEDAFEVTIPDADAERMTTPGDVADWLVTRLTPPNRKPAACATARTFYDLRAALGGKYGVCRAAVRPKSRIGDLIPEGKRSAWHHFARDHHFPRPAFRWFGERFAPEDTTIAELVRASLAHRRDQWFDREGRAIREVILLNVRIITSEQTGVRLEDVEEHSRFVQDLHMD